VHSRRDDDKKRDALFHFFIVIVLILFYTSPLCSFSFTRDDDTARQIAAEIRRG